MRSSDWKVIGLIGIVLGVTFIPSGIVAWNYAVAYQIIIPLTGYPYRDYAVPLMAFGTVFLVVGVVCLWRAGQEKRREEEAQEKVVGVEVGEGKGSSSSPPKDKSSGSEGLTV